MAIQFKKATKERSKLKLALFGPSGSGKTYSALRIARGLGGKVAVIDTEHGTASKYADRFDFDVLDLETRKVFNYVEAMNAAVAAGYDVLIIDSMTHAWNELVEDVGKIAKAKYQGNTWSAWSEGNPIQKSFITAILSFPAHLIVTMRSRTEWDASKDERGKVKPVRVGLSPEQGKDIEYEFDMLLELSPEHVANVLKDRTGKFQDKIIELPGEELGQHLSEWLLDGKEPISPKASLSPEDYEMLHGLPFATPWVEIPHVERDLYVGAVKQLILDVGYDTEDKRKNLLVELFQQTNITKFSVGFIRLLERYALYLSDHQDNLDDAIKHATQVVRYGTAESSDWDTAFAGVHDQAE